jgi:hypothetical protein
MLAHDLKSPVMRSCSADLRLLPRPILIESCKTNRPSVVASACNFCDCLSITIRDLKRTSSTEIRNTRRPTIATARLTPWLFGLLVGDGWRRVAGGWWWWLVARSSVLSRCCYRAHDARRLISLPLVVPFLPGCGFLSPTPHILDFSAQHLWKILGVGQSAPSDSW